MPARRLPWRQPPGASSPAPSAVSRVALPPRLALLVAGAVLQMVLLVWWSAGDGAPSAARSVAAFGVFALMLATLVAAAALPPARAPAAGTRRARLYRGATLPLLVVLALMVLVTGWVAGNLVVTAATDPRVYVSDAAAFNHYDAELITRGQNPYTADARFWDAVRRFPASGATPLRRGRYARGVWGPTLDQVRRDVRLEAANPAARGPEFATATLHSYPALAFLLYVPLVWAGLPSTMLLSLLALAAFVVAIGRQLPAGYRLVGWGLLLANTLGTVLALRGSIEVVALLPALLAWQTLERRWVSPLLLGLACAVKQLVWPLAPLYLILVARREGWRAALMRGLVALGAFLVPNLPFAIAAPAAWARSLVLPMSLPLFPDGVGLVALARGGLLPLWPPAVYATLEVVALAALVVWCARARPLPRPELVLLLGLLPFTLAWRSQSGYFAYSTALALYAVIPLLRGQHAAESAEAAASGRTAMSVREPADVAAASSGAAGAWWDGVSRWLARGDVRASLAVTLGLRLLCSALAAALPLLWSGVYPWRNPFHAALYPPGSPRPVYTPLDYLIQPWDRWDTGWYTEIAQHGYVWFGSTFFPPLYPALIRVAMPLVGGDAVAAALLIATVAAFFAFLALYRLAERFAPGGELGAPTLLVAALLPTSFFLMAGYSEALFLALSLWALLAAVKEQWGRMALLGALAAITRQQGFVLAALAFPCVWLWGRWLWQRLSQVRVAAPHPVDTMPRPPGWRPLAAAAAPVLAYAGWLVAQRTLLHAPLPWTLLAAPGWDLHFTWPGSGLFADLAALFIRPPTGAHVVIMSIALDAGMSLAAAVALLISVRRLPPGVVLYLAAMWCSGHIKVLPSGLTVSEGRYMRGLLPLCVVPAGWLARGGPARRVAWVTIGLLGLMLYLWTFVLGGWVA